MEYDIQVSRSIEVRVRNSRLVLIPNIIVRAELKQGEEILVLEQGFDNWVNLYLDEGEKWQERLDEVMEELEKEASRFETYIGAAVDFIVKQGLPIVFHREDYDC